MLTIGEDCWEVVGDEETVVAGLVVVGVDARDLDLDLYLLRGGLRDGPVVDELDWFPKLSHNEGFLCRRHVVCLYLSVNICFGVYVCTFSGVGDEMR